MYLKLNPLWVFHFCVWIVHFFNFSVLLSLHFSGDILKGQLFKEAKSFIVIEVAYNYATFKPDRVQNATDHQAQKGIFLVNQVDFVKISCRKKDLLKDLPDTQAVSVHGRCWAYDTNEHGNWTRRSQDGQCKWICLKAIRPTTPNSVDSLTRSQITFCSA